MAFKPITKEKEINGVKFIAQFNGISMREEIGYLSSENVRKVAPYLFENVLVEPKIADVDEFFGTDAVYYDEVTSFLLAVGRADPEYFPRPKSDKDGAKGKE